MKLALVCYRCNFCDVVFTVPSTVEGILHWRNVYNNVGRVDCVSIVLAPFIHRRIVLIKRGWLQPCWKCKSCEHVGALCPDLKKSQVDINPCLHMGDMNLLLPIVWIMIVSWKTEKTFNCLLDSGSQCSYLSDGVPDILHCHSAPMRKRDFIIKIFLNSAIIYKGWQQFCHSRFRLGKVLGYLYDSAQDDLHVAINFLEVAADNKRGILSQTSSIFYPFGLSLHMTIKGRILLSEIWKMKLTWNYKIPSELQRI